jgi:hypothetical protein
MKKDNKPLPNLPLFSSLSATGVVSSGNMQYSRPSQQEYWMKDEHVRMLFAAPTKTKKLKLLNDLDVSLSLFYFYLTT